MQRGCLAKADSPRRRSSHSPPPVLPCRPLLPQEWRFLPFLMAEKVWDLLVCLKINLVCFPPTGHIPFHSLLWAQLWPRDLVRSQWLP